MNNSQFSPLLLKDVDLTRFIFSSLKEDIGRGDHTTLACIPKNAKGKSKLIIKGHGIIAGVSLAEKIFHSYDKNLSVHVFLADGAKVAKGDIVFTVEGSARSILTTERLVLNCMQRMSGIATATKTLVERCKPYRVKVADTRKTSPGMRALEKWAVRIGGGYNHRSGLYDMILIKNNHIDFAGGIANAIQSANNYLKNKKLKLKIEIEARNLKEVKEIISAGNVDRILLDNFSIPDIKKTVQFIDGKFETEISGGVNEKNIHKYASCKVNYISVGALTHSVKSLDMSLTAV